ncbi:Response regulator receiver domain-containing protein [Mucilaginibacter gossypiicola]|uniref:Response regulator receiver domain-containing protein n=1 Tax=Mucilaginibacter gossypiicola TaxID=551995 RepID=A0A1H8KUA3_9SPHI|nr:Response regulator receiver domain-containing protein [Mucilaginibacter gossypiicola]
MRINRTKHSSTNKRALSNVYSLVGLPIRVFCYFRRPVTSEHKEKPATAALPVIVISASNDGKSIAMNAGASDLIAKPFDLAVLIKKVNPYIKAA